MAHIAVAAAAMVVGGIIGGITGGKKGAMLGMAGGALGGLAGPALGGAAGTAGSYGVSEGAGYMLGDVAGTAAAGAVGGAAGGAAGAGVGGFLSGVGGALEGASPYISTVGSLASAFMGDPGSAGVMDYEDYRYAPTGGKAIAPDLSGMDIKYATTGERTPQEIDSANKLRIQREQSYASQRARAESDLLRALSARDISSGLNEETAFRDNRTAAQRFVGLPPTLGQARHSWA